MATRVPRLIRAAQGLAVLGLVAHALHALGAGGAALDPVFDDWLYNALVLLAAAICAARAAWWREERRSWAAFGAALLLWAAGELAYTALSGPGGEPPFPSLADAFYLSFYLLAYAGLGGLLRRRVGGLGSTVWLDGAVAANAAAALGAAVLFGVVLDATGGTAAEVAVNLAYPLGDIVLFALVVGAFSLAGRRPDRQWVLIGVSFVALAAADGVFLFQVSDGTYEAGTILDTLWPASALLLAAAAWLPPSPSPAPASAPPRRLLGAPVALGSLGLGVLAYDHFQRVNGLAFGLAVATLLGVVARTLLTFRENQRLLARSREQAVSDELTGLANRRRLLADLEHELATPAGSPALLLLFDLDGFKGYNDTFGHPAGDALLQRFGRSLAAAVAGRGNAYRLGGDEFCVLAPLPEGGAGSLIDACAAALTEESGGFAIGASFGASFLPDEAATPSEALRLADQRLYAHKQERRLEAGRKPEDVLLRALYEREPRLRDHARRVAALAVAVGRRLGLEGVELRRLARAAELHDVGKLAVPDAILHKPGPLDAEERRLVESHPAVGERILSASPALTPVARIVRSTHERFDGAGYPDGLAGEDIPLGARVIAVCDAFVAMVSERPYRPARSADGALAELRRGAGTQFDPSVVLAFGAVVAERPELPAKAGAPALP